MSSVEKGSTGPLPSQWRDTGDICDGLRLESSRWDQVHTHVQTHTYTPLMYHTKSLTAHTVYKLKF